MKRHSPITPHEIQIKLVTTSNPHEFYSETSQESIRTFSNILIFFNARILCVGICIALCTTLLAPLPIAPNILISWEAHLYVFSL